MFQPHFTVAAVTGIVRYNIISSCEPIMTLMASGRFSHNLAFQFYVQQVLFAKILLREASCPPTKIIGG